MEDISNYEKLKEDAQKFYNEIGNVFSPAFKQSIHFNSEGFNHIIFKSPRTERERSSQILRFKLFHEIDTYVPYYAFSAGTELALTGKTIYMGKCAIMGNVDPQIPVEVPEHINTSYQADIIINEHHKATNLTLLDVCVIGNASKYLQDSMSGINNILVKNNYPDEAINKVINQMCKGKTTHNTPLDVVDLQNLGLNVVEEMPDYISRIMNELYVYIDKFNET